TNEFQLHSRSKFGRRFASLHAMSAKLIRAASPIAILVVGIFVVFGSVQVIASSPAETASGTASIAASSNPTPAATPTSNPATATNPSTDTWTDSGVKWLQAIQAFIAGIITWPILIGVLAWYFRDSIGDFVRQLIRLMPDRSLTIDLHAVKLQMGERP